MRDKESNVIFTGECDLCQSDDRLVVEGNDSFGVHVLNVCAFGCSDARSIPPTNPEYDPMETAEAWYNDRPCFFDDLINEIPLRGQN